MSGFVFIIVLFGLSFWSLPCQGQVSPPPEGKTFVVEPGENVTIKWSYGNAGTVLLRSWTFEGSDGRPAELLASISRDGDPVIEKNSLPGVEIEKPATLILRNVSLRYNGTYDFILTGPPNGLSKVELFVAGPLNMSVCSSPITANESSNVACLCKAERENSPEACVAWYDEDGKQIGGVGKGMKELNLSNVNRPHTGIYTCKVDSYGVKQNKSVNLTVNFASVKTQFTVVNRTDSNVTLKCKAEGLPEPIYEIKFNGTIINTNKADTVVVHYSNLQLYSCTSINMLGSDSVNLTLPVAPVNTTFTYEWKSNGNATLKCKAEGVPEPTYEIKYTGTIILSSQNGTVEVNGTMLGLYFCKSKNIIGFQSANLTLSAPPTTAPTTTPPPSPTSANKTSKGPVTPTTSTTPTKATTTKKSSRPPTWLIILIVILVLLFLLLITFLVWRFQKKKSGSERGTISQGEHVELGGHENPYDSIDTAAKTEGSAPAEAPEASKKEPVVYATVDKSRKSEPEGVTYASLDTLAMNSGNGGSTKRDPKPRQETEYADIAEYGKKK